MDFIPVIPIVLISVFIGTSVIPYLYSNGKLRKIFKKTAAELNLNFYQPSIFHKPKINGNFKNITVSVD